MSEECKRCGRVEPLHRHLVHGEVYLGCAQCAFELQTLYVKITVKVGPSYMTALVTHDEKERICQTLTSKN